MSCLEEEVKLESETLPPQGEAACRCNCDGAAPHQCVKAQDPSHAAPESTVTDPTGQHLACQHHELQPQPQECWICFGSGTPVSTAAATTSQADDAGAANLASPADARDSATAGPDDHTPHSTAHRSSRPGSPGSEALVAPCSVCRGSMGWVHRRCLSRWLHTCWSFSCPNCTQPLRRSVLASVPAGRLWGSLLSGLEASRSEPAPSCSEDAGAASTFPPGALVCLELPGHNGHIRFSIPSAHCTATEVARRIACIVGGLQGAGAGADAEPLLCHASLQVQQQQQQQQRGSGGSGPGDVTASLISPPPPGASHASRVDALLIWQCLLSLHQSPAPSAPGPEGPTDQVLRGAPDSPVALDSRTPSSQVTSAFRLPLHLAAGSGAGIPGVDPVAAAPLQRLQPSPAGADPSGRRAWVRQQLGQQGEGRAAAAAELQQALGGRAGDAQAQGLTSSWRSPLWTLRDPPPPAQRPVQRRLQDARRVNGRRRC